MGPILPEATAAVGSHIALKQHKVKKLTEFTLLLQVGRK
jgi:hypothetical protein